MLDARLVAIGKRGIGDEVFEQAFQNQQTMADKVVVGLLVNGFLQLRLSHFFFDEQATTFFLGMRFARHDFFVSLDEQGTRERGAPIQLS
ncbi:MAG: hypothetical protein WDM76_11055 [Limisphaerales bacterium]